MLPENLRHPFTDECLSHGAGPYAGRGVSPLIAYRYLHSFPKPHTSLASFHANAHQDVPLTEADSAFHFSFHFSLTR